MKKFFQKLKYNMLVVGLVLAIASLVFGVGFIKYKFWRAEHPQAKTWTFFIPKG
jgi:hypothetical protein